MEQTYSGALVRFIQEHPSVYHVIEGQRQQLLAAGYEQLLESRPWCLRPGGRYFVTRNGSALIAFRIPEGDFRGFMMMASHSDSPALKIKEKPEITVEGTYKKLNVEVYGGALLSPWFDRPLSVAGRLYVRQGNAVRMELVDFRRDLLLIPSLAIHMEPTANKGLELKAQRDLLPLYGLADARDLLTLAAREAGVDPAAVVGHDLFVYNRQAPSVWGDGGVFLSSPRLDDLQCAFASLQGFLESRESASVPVHVVFDNEEIGSSTRQGAASPFLRDTLVRLSESLGLSEGAYLAMLSQSFLLSADNVHALHPNRPDKSDPVNRPRLGGGVVLKYSGSQKYTTDAASAAIVTLLAERAGISLQTFANHSDIPGGSTLGNLSARQVAVKAADVGIAQLAMHSPYETCGSHDTEDLVALARELFSASLEEAGENCYSIL